MTKVYITESGYKLNVASTLRMTASEAETLLDGVFEPVLGNPGTNGYVLSSTTAGVRSWVASASDVTGITTTTGSSTNMLRVAAAGGLEYRTTAQVLSDIGAAPTASPTFTGTVTLPTTVASVIKPASDSTTALQLANAAGTAVLTVDTTNSKATVTLPAASGTVGLSVARSGVAGYIQFGDQNAISGRFYPALDTYSVGGNAITARIQNMIAGGDDTGTNPVAEWIIRATTGAIASRVLWKLKNYTTQVMGVTKDGYLAVGAHDGTAYADIAASTTAAASLRIRSGTAPTTPNDGDIWNDGTDFNLYGSGLKLHSGVIKPASDSTTALQLANAAGAAVVTVNTTNKYFVVDSYMSIQFDRIRQTGGSVFYLIAYDSVRINTTTGGGDPLVAKGKYVGLGVVGADPTASADIAASTTAAASLRIRSGTAPTTPNDGDIWYDGSNLKIRIGAITYNVDVTAT